MREIDVTLKFALSIQLAILSIVSLELLGFQTFILREIVGFIYLTFIPGILLLKILRIQDLNFVDRLLYSVGLSIAFTMILGLLANGIYPALGIFKPISIVPLMFTLTAFVSVLWIICYLRSEPSPHSSQINLPKLPVSSVLFICLIPLTGIVGTLLVASNQSNILLLTSIVLVPIVILLAVSNKFPKEVYPIAIVAIALTLFYQYNLLSPYLMGADIHAEYYFTTLVINTSFWDSTLVYSTIATAYNAMASVVILCPVYSLVLSLDSIWVLKIIYPIFFSLVPLGLYSVLRKQLSDKLAFLSTIFFISFFTFFTELMSLARQQIGELFFILLILLMVDKKMSSKKGTLLCITFAGMLVISHYALTYLFMLFFLIVPWLLLVLLKNQTLKPLFLRIRRALRMYRGEINLHSVTFKYILLSNVFIIYFVCIAFSWYLYVSRSYVMGIFLHSAQKVYNNIDKLFSLSGREIFASQAFGGSLRIESLQNELFRILFLITVVFIVIGFFKLIWKPGKLKLNPEFFYMALGGFGLMLASVILPGFSRNLNITRIYHISLFFLSPLFVIGGLYFFKVTYRLFRRRLNCEHRSSSAVSLFLLSLVLITYFLFNTGFVQEVTGDVPFSISLNPQRMQQSVDMAKANFNIQYTFETEVFSTVWLSAVRNPDSIVYADNGGRHHVLVSSGMIIANNTGYLYDDVIDYPVDSYIYLRRLNVIDGLVSVEGGGFFNLSQINPLFDSVNKIYSNGESDIYCIVGQQP